MPWGHWQQLCWCGQCPQLTLACSHMPWQVLGHANPRHSPHLKGDSAEPLLPMTPASTHRSKGSKSGWCRAQLTYPESLRSHRWVLRRGRNRALMTFKRSF